MGLRTLNSLLPSNLYNFLIILSITKRHSTNLANHLHIRFDNRKLEVLSDTTCNRGITILNMSEESEIITCSEMVHVFTYVFKFI